MDLLSNDINSIAGSYLNEVEDDNYTQNYVGQVLDNNDPLKWGRCKVRVHGLHDDIPNEDLPWATPEFALPIGPKGSWIIPEVGTIVYVKFDDGDFYEPLYGSAVLDLENINFEADKDEDYPDSVILYETKNGDYLKINRAKGEMTLKSGSGVVFKFNQNGDIKLVNNNTENGDLQFKLRGNQIFDNRLGNTSVITTNINVSAFGNISTLSNGSVITQSLDNIEFLTNSEFDVISDRTSIKSRAEIRTETIENNVFANTVNILPATSEIETVDVNNVSSTIPQEFSVSIGDNLLKVPTMQVIPDPTGGPFQAIPFDTLTGLPAQGRKVIGSINSSGFLSDDAEKALEIAKMKANIETKYAKILSTTLTNITKQYASIDSQAQLIVAGMTQNSALLEQQTIDIKNATDTIEAQKQAELNLVDEIYSGYLTKPIFGTIVEGPWADRIKYEEELKAAESITALDVTNKTNPRDIVPAKGLVNDDA